MTVLGSAEVELTLDSRGAARAAERNLTKDLNRAGQRGGEQLGDGIAQGADGKLREARAGFAAEGERSGAGFSDGFNKGVQRVKIDSFAQKIRDVRTLYSASIGPIKNYADQIGHLAVRAGAASAAIGAGVGLGGGLLSVVGSLASIGAAAPVAIAAFIGLKAASAVAKVGLLGVGDALDKAVGDSFKKIAPNAQAFVDQVRRMVPSLVAVKNAIQNNLFEGLTKFLRPLAERYLPLATKQGAEFAAVFNFGLQRAVQGALNPKTAQAFTSILAAGVEVVGAFAAPLRGLVPVLAQVAATGASVFRDAGVAAASYLGDLQQALQKGLTSGGLKAGIQAGVQAAGDLVRVLGNVGGVFLSVQRAAQQVFGTNLLGLIANVTGGLRQFLQTGPGADVLADTFGRLQPVLIGVGQAVSALLPQVLSLVPVIASLATAFLTGLQPVIPVVGELARTLGGALASVLPAVSRLAIAVGQALTGALKAVAPVIGPLAGAVAGLLGPTGAFQSLVEAIAPVLPTVAKGLAAVVAGAGTGLSAVFKALAPSLPAVAKGFAALGDAVGKGLSDALTRIAPAMPALAEAVTALIGALAQLAPAALLAFADIVVAIAPVLPKAASAIESLASGLSKLGPAVGFVGTLAAALFTLGEVIGKVIGAIVFLPARLSIMAGGFGNLARAAVEAIPGMTTLTTALRGLNDSGKGGTFLNDLPKSIDKLGGSLNASAGAQREQERDTENASAAMEAQAGSAETLGAALDRLAGRAVDNTRADIAAREAKDRLTKALKENGKSFDLNTPAGKANTTALLDARDAAARYAEAQEKLHPGIGRGTAAFKQYVAQLNATLRAAGVSEKAIAAFNKEILATPPSPTVTPKADTAAAQAKLDQLAEQRQAPVIAVAATAGAEVGLNNTARRRQADIIAAASTANAEARLRDVARNRQARITAAAVGAASADARLNEIARNRTTTIYARAAAGDAEAYLNDVARDRTSVIRVTTIGGGLGGQRMAGGPVEAGVPYLVGEAGPEIVVPKASGTVIPNDKAFGQAHSLGIGGGPVELGPNTIRALAAAFAASRPDVYLGREKVGAAVSRSIGGRLAGMGV